MVLGIDIVGICGTIRRDNITITRTGHKQGRSSGLEQAENMKLMEFISGLENNKSGTSKILNQSSKLNFKG